MRNEGETKGRLNSDREEKVNESGWIEKTARSLFVDEILPGKIYARGRNGVKLAHSSFKF